MGKKILHLLHVEDDENDQLFFMRAVQTSGLPIRVGVAANGQEALSYLEGCFAMRAPAPDYVLLDIRMPMMSGFEFLAIAKETERFRELVVVIFSTAAQANDVARARELGANAYVIKPNGMVGLADFVKELYECWVRSSVPNRWPDFRPAELCP